MLVPLIDAASLAAPDPAGEIVRIGGETMGTGWSLAGVTRDANDGERFRQLALASFATVVAQMSQWEPSSEISRFNRSAAGSWHVLSPQFATVLACALDLAEASNGAFDPCIGAASELWGFGASAAPHARPSQDEIETTRRHNWQDVRFDRSARRIYQPGGMALDLSGIAKGFAVDHAVATLKRAGFVHILIEIGGELRGSGLRPDGQPWWVDIESPHNLGIAPARIGLANLAVATSGSYLRRRGTGASSYGHIFCPDTGRPCDNGVVSVSVVHSGCMQADALATALAAMGTQQGVAFADRHRLAARLIDGAGATTSRAWRDMAA